MSNGLLCRKNIQNKIYQSIFKCKNCAKSKKMLKAFEEFPKWKYFRFSGVFEKNVYFKIIRRVFSWSIFYHISALIGNQVDIEEDLSEQIFMEDKWFCFVCRNTTWRVINRMIFCLMILEKISCDWPNSVVVSRSWESFLEHFQEIKNVVFCLMQPMSTKINSFTRCTQPFCSIERMWWKKGRNGEGNDKNHEKQTKDRQNRKKKIVIQWKKNLLRFEIDFSSRSSVKLEVLTMQESDIMPFKNPVVLWLVWLSYCDLFVFQSNGNEINSKNFIRTNERSNGGGRIMQIDFYQTLFRIICSTMESILKVSQSFDKTFVQLLNLISLIRCSGLVEASNFNRYFIAQVYYYIRNRCANKIDWSLLKEIRTMCLGRHVHFQSLVPLPCSTSLRGIQSIEHLKKARNLIG